MNIEKTIFSRVFPVAGLLLITCIACYSANTHAGKLYKWVDENGVVHYSDRMPPDLSKSAHQELDEHGIARHEVERAKSDEERMAEQVEQSMQEQQRRAEAEKLARQRMRDQILLQTFTTERDLIITRDDRLNAVESIINLTLNNNKRLVSQIEETQDKISRTVNSGREIPENLAKQLENLNGQYEKNKEYIELKQKERQELDDSFTDDLQRFRELKGIELESGQAPVSVPDSIPQDMDKLPKPGDIGQKKED
jgi:YesN/AraC family two-component response regulator